MAIMDASAGTKFMMSIRIQRIQSNSRIVDLHFSFFLLSLLS